MRTIHPWLQKVHTFMLEKGARMTARQASQTFGEPEGTTASKLMHAGLKATSGYFIATQHQYVGYEGGIVDVTVFIAISKARGISQDLPRVNSVWQLAELV